MIVNTHSSCRTFNMNKMKTNKGEKYSLWESDTKCPNPPKENLHQKKDSKQIDKNDSNNKQTVTSTNN